MRYIPEIDGLRAISVTAVVLYHAAPEFLCGGFTGVDVFFVISGYLVTSILLRERDETGQILLAGFWKRRARRLLPTGLTVVASTLILGVVFLDAAALKSLGEQATSTLLFFANVFMWRQANDYWAPAAESLPLLHTWSLAVEEQFYFVLPFFVWGLSRRKLTILLGAIFVGSFIASYYGTMFHPAAAFYLIPSRAWELLSGSFLAIALTRTSFPFTERTTRHLEKLCHWCGIGMIGFGFLALSENSSFPTPAALTPVLGTLLVIFAAHLRPEYHQPFIASVSFTYVGKISYALYLWHWPLLTFCRLQSLSIWVFWLCIPASILTYELIEKPTRRRASIKIMFAIFLGVVVSSLLLSLGLIKPLTVAAFPAPVLSSGYDSQAHLDDDGVHVNQDTSLSRVLVFGNSMAYQHAELINKVFPEYWITYLTVGGTPTRFLDEMEDGTDTQPPVTWTHSQRTAFDDLRRRALATRPAIVIASERWNVVEPIEKQRTKALMLTLLEQADRVIVFLDCPALDVPETMSMQDLASQYVSSADRETLSEIDGVSESRAAARRFFYELRTAHPRLSVVDPEAILRADGVLRVVADGQIVFGNRTHLSIAGTLLLEPSLRSAAGVPNE